MTPSPVKGKGKVGRPIASQAQRKRLLFPKKMRNQKVLWKRKHLQALHLRNPGMKGLKMKPSLGNIKSDDGLGREFIFKNRKREKEKEKKRGKNKEKLLKIEYGLTHVLSMLFSPLVENNIFFFFFFLKENHCVFNSPFLSTGLLFVMITLSLSPFSQ